MNKHQAIDWTLYVIETADSGKPKTGDAANITLYRTLDGGTTTLIVGTVVEEDAANAKGLYRVPLTAAETNGDHAVYSGKSSTGDIEVIPRVIDPEKSLTVDNNAEPASVPAANATIAAKIGFIYAYLRNKKTTTDTTETLRNDADSADIASATLADDSTTTTKNKLT